MKQKIVTCFPKDPIWNSPYKMAFNLGNLSKKKSSLKCDDISSHGTIYIIYSTMHGIMILKKT